MFVVQAYLKTALFYSFIYKSTFMAFYYIVSFMYDTGEWNGASYKLRLFQ